MARRDQALDEGRKDQQLHLKIGEMDLEEFVWRLAASANRSLAAAGMPAGRAVMDILHDSLRDELKRCVVGCDVCGLGDLCRAAEEFDPWTNR